MPLIFKGTCVECGHSMRTTTHYGAIAQDDGSLVALPHPCESLTLRELGLTWHQVGWQGRYVLTKILLCQHCGGIYERRKIMFPGVPGLLPVSTVAFSVAALLLLLKWNSIWLAMVGGCLATAVVLSFWQRCVGTLSRYRAGKSGRTIGDRPCCDAPRPVPPNAWDRTVFPCPSCGAEAVKFECVGIS